MLKAILIDDERWSREIIRNFGRWHEHGIEIVGEAEDGGEGLDLAERLKPDIIVTDMQMPHMDGVAMLRALQERSSHARIIVISGHDDFVYMKQAILSKAFEYLLKPIVATELNAVLARCAAELQRVRKADPTAAYRRIDPEVAEALQGRLKGIGDAISRHDADGAADLLRAAIALLLSGGLHEEASVHLLFERLSERLHDQVLAPAGYPEETVQALTALKRDAEAGLSAAAFLAIFDGILRRNAAYVRENLQKRTRSLPELAEAHIVRHYRENISLESVAAHFFVSKEYLGNAYKARYGTTIGKRVLQLRMEEAKALLREGRPHADIAQRLGFQDKTYFYKVFKKYYGCTPTDAMSSPD